jgi:hypothetical protein
LATPAVDPELTDDSDLDGDGESPVARGSGEVRLPGQPASAQPLVEALRPLAEADDPDDPDDDAEEGGDYDRSEDTQPHHTPGWRRQRSPSQRPLIDSLRAGDDELAPPVENPPKGDLN